MVLHRSSSTPREGNWPSARNLWLHTSQSPPISHPRIQTISVDNCPSTCMFRSQDGYKVKQSF